MAIFHFSTKSISRGKGQSIVASAAYRSGEKIYDERQGRNWDYTHRAGVEHTEIVLPEGAPEWAKSRGELWNQAEKAEKRKDACVGREFEIALPAELNAEERKKIAVDFAREIAERHKCAVDISIHLPDKKGDQRNHHAHVLLSTRRLEADGFGAKTRELDAKESRGELVVHWRERFADLTNTALERNGQSERVDHRSLKAQGIDREPGIHLGPGAIGYERRTGEKSQRREDYEAEINARLAEAARVGREERERKQRQGPRLELDGSERWKDELARYEREATREKAVEEKLAAKEREEEEAEERRKQEVRNRFVYAEVEAEETPRHYIDVGPWDVDLVREAGAEYDYRAGKWYVPENMVDACLSRPGAIVDRWREEIERQKRVVEEEHKKEYGRPLELEKTRYNALAERYAEYEAKGESSGLDRLKGRLIETKTRIKAMELKPNELEAEAERRAKKAEPSAWLAVKIVEDEQKKKAKEEAEKRKQAEEQKRTLPSKPKGRGFW